MSAPPPPVLLIGGSGLIGAETARTLRRLHPGLPIAIGGRDAGRGRAVAREIGLASFEPVDLDATTLGLPADKAFGAVAVLVKDHGENAARYALDHGIPHISISSAAFEIVTEASLHARRKDAAPIVLASHWAAGAATLAALGFARAYAHVDAIRISALVDDRDPHGPAAIADLQHMARTSPFALARTARYFRWIGGDEMHRTIVDSAGASHGARGHSPLDVASLAAATDAPSVRFDLAIGETPQRRAGGAPSTEIVIEIEGTRRDGTTGSSRHEVIHPGGRAALTGLCVALLVERAAGLAGGAPIAPGLYLPEVLLDPGGTVDRLIELGATIRTAAIDDRTEGSAR